MIINLSPVRMDEDLLVSREGDILYVNGEVFDFSPLPEGAFISSSAINSEWFIGDVSREGGELHLTLKLPCPANAPQEMCFPSPLNVDYDGTITLPGDQPNE